MLLRKLFAVIHSNFIRISFFNTNIAGFRRVYYAKLIFSKPRQNCHGSLRSLDSPNNRACNSELLVDDEIAQR